MSISNKHQEERARKLSFWQSQVIKWEKSDKSVTEYCKLYKLNAAKFFYWRAELKKANKRNEPA